MELFNPRVTWTVPGSAPELNPDTVNLWRLFLPGMAAYRPHAMSALSEQEREELERIQRAKSRDAYLLTRGILRALLALRLKCLPGDVGEGDLREAGVVGPNDPRASALFYASAWSGDWAMIALCRSARVGVALEWAVERRQNPRLASQVLSRREWHALQEADSSQQERLLLDLLARKHALSQATGLDTDRTLKHITVPLSSEPALFRPDRNIPEMDRSDHQWWISPLAWASGYVASLCTRPVVNRVSTWQWTIDCVNFLPMRSEAPAG